MSIVDNLFKFELFAVPVWNKAQRAVKNKDVDLFRKRWPIWSQRLHHFPEIEAELFSEIFKEKDLTGLQPYQKDFLEIFFEHTQLKKTNSFVATTLSRLCLSHNWEALSAVQQYIPFNAQTHTVIACAMTHEATSASWDRHLSRPRLSIQTVEQYIQDNQILPYEHLENIWQNTVFYSKFNGFKTNIYNFSVRNPIDDHFSVLPNFDQKSLWEYTIINVCTTQMVQKIVDMHPLSAEYLWPLFLRRHPLDKDFVYDLIQQKFPLCDTLKSILINAEPLKSKVDYTNIVKILKEVSSPIAPAFEDALEQIANEKQRQKLLKETSSAQSVSRRKM